MVKVCNFFMVKRKVTKIIDGDTFVVDKPVRGSKYIRIADINTPEKGQRDFVEFVGFVVLRLMARVLQHHELDIGQHFLKLGGELGRWREDAVLFHQVADTGRIGGRH